MPKQYLQYLRQISVLRGHKLAKSTLCSVMPINYKTKLQISETYLHSRKGHDS